MDSAEDLEIKEAMSAGHPQTDEGPYYHISWWESYKGGVKGKLGGVAIGALIGAAVGLVAAGLLSFAVTGGVSVLAVTAGFAAGGMLYGAHEFSEVGKITGAVASAHEKAEERMKSFENSKFLEIKKEINELKALITGKAIPAENQLNSSAEITQDYKTQHSEGGSPGFKPVFWKIAAIGLAVGLAAGALLAFGGVSEHVIHALGVAAEPLSETGTLMASMTALGLFGASFGINRDIFRGIFDKTDHLFRGILSAGGKKQDQAPEVYQSVVQNNEISENTITTVVYEGFADYPQSDTHHRDKVLSQAKQTLLSMDHTKAIPH